MTRYIVTVVLATSLASSTALGDVRYRSFSASAAIGPPAEAFAAKLKAVTAAALGPAGAVNLVRIPGAPPVPLGGDVVAAVAAGEAGGGLDAAYISGGDLNRAWGFIFNSGVPFGPTFDEFLGFLYGPGLPAVQALMDRRGVVAFPIVGSPEQLSGYFPEPMSSVRGRHGISLAGLCQRTWTLRYLPPGQDVLGLACDELVAQGKIHRKSISFVAAIPGGGSLVEAVKAGDLQGFEFATPLDDVSQLFSGADNPGTVGVRFVHTPGWQQQFLVTWMIVNKTVWSTLSAGQQAIFATVARDHVLSSYADNVSRQGAALQQILGANRADSDPRNDVAMSRWSMRDQARLRDATARFLNARIDDPSLPAADRADYAQILEALRLYVRANDSYWDLRQVDASSRFEGWVSPAGECWTDARCDR